MGFREERFFTMEKFLQLVGRAMYAFRAIMSLYFLGLVAVMLFLLKKFVTEVAGIFSPDKTFTKMELIIKVLEMVDMVMVAQLVWVVAMAGFSLFVTEGHFSDDTKKKPDWLDHVDTYNLKLKLAFAIVSISGVHALKTYLQGAATTETMYSVLMHLIFVVSLVGTAYAYRMTNSRSGH